MRPGGLQGFVKAVGQECMHTTCHEPQREREPNHQAQFRRLWHSLRCLEQALRKKFWTGKSTVLNCVLRWKRTNTTPHLCRPYVPRLFVRFRLWIPRRRGQKRDQHPILLIKLERQMNEWKTKFSQDQNRTLRSSLWRISIDCCRHKIKKPTFSVNPQSPSPAIESILVISCSSLMSAIAARLSLSTNVFGSATLIPLSKFLPGSARWWSVNISACAGEMARDAHFHAGTSGCSSRRESINSAEGASDSCFCGSSNNVTENPGILRLVYLFFCQSCSGDVFRLNLPYMFPKGCG